MKSAISPMIHFTKVDLPSPFFPTKATLSPRLIVKVTSGVVKVRLDKSPDSPPVVMDRKDVKVIRDGKLKVGKEERANLSNLEE